MSVPHGIDRSGAPGGTGAQSMVGALGELTDPGADRLLCWDDSAGDLAFFDLSTGLTFSGTTLVLDAELQAISGLVSAADKLPYFTGSGTAALTDFPSFARTLTASSTALQARTTLGVASTDAEGDMAVGYDADSSVSVPLPSGGANVINGKISFSVSSNALTLALKGLNGSDPSASNPVYVVVAQGNPADGTYAIRKVISAVTLTISSGSTLGHLSATASVIHQYLIDSAGTIELAVSTTFYGFSGVKSTVAEGGAGGADSASDMYSTTARLNARFVCVGRSQDTQTTAGTWTATPSIIELAPFEISHSTQTFLTSGTWNAPNFVTEAWVFASGGGGGGGPGTSSGCTGPGCGGGGGAGDAVTGTRVVTVPGTAYTVTIGGGGGSGAAGGTTSLGALVSVSGGNGGGGTVNASNLGGAANGRGGGGQPGMKTSPSFSGNGGSGPFGGGARGTLSADTGGDSAGSNSGAGGGGGRRDESGSVSGGSGGSGFLRVQW